MIIYMLAFAIASLSVIAFDDLNLGRNTRGVSDTLRNKQK